MKEIELSQGYVTQVDDEDFDWLSQWNWQVSIDPRRPHAVKYARRGMYVDGKKVGSITMHRAIMGAPEGITVDHIDGDGLNNQRVNLRFATYQQQAANRIGSNASGIKGVRLHRNRWEASIEVRSKYIYLGLYDTIEEAAAAYAIAARAHFGEFALTEEEDKK